VIPNQALRYFVCLSIFSIALGCARNTQSGKTPPALPASWVDPTAKNLPLNAGDDEPSPEVTASVQTAFRAHTMALENASLRSEISIQSNKQKAGKPTPKYLDPKPETPSDEVPWHLDGIVGSFAIDVGGVFGMLVADGVPSIKVTWQKQAATESVNPHPARKSKGIRFRANMTRDEMLRTLEPAVQSAIATKSVSDITNFRRNLTREGMRFLSLTRVMSTVPAARGWHVDGYQLLLSFNASGDFTPAIGIGGGVAVFFDWEATSSVPKSSLSTEEAALKENMGGFVQSISSIIPAARADATEIRKAGFELGVFQIGLGITAGGTIGIASTQGAAVGRIIFKKDEHGAAPSARTIGVMLPENDAILPVNFISTAQPGVKLDSSVAISRQDGGIVVSQVPPERVRDGLRRAINMGAFFARNTAAVDSARWKCTEIEAGFDVTINGDLTFMTVGGTGLVRLGFERVN
jgi:hypothetical protein